jgi:diguanylate cyclase (GGDEF)-like protein
MTASSARAESVIPSHEALSREAEALREQVRELTVRLAEAEQLADRDTLTPLYNRRAFLRELQRSIAVARRHDLPASLIYLDLDGFKQVNDLYGHAAGDAALIAVAGRLIAEVRESDVVGRLGGDEFAVLMLHADKAVAQHKAEALGAAIARAPIGARGHSFFVTATWGVREIAGADTPEQALAEADAVMYLRKPPRG